VEVVAVLALAPVAMVVRAAEAGQAARVVVAVSAHKEIAGVLAPQLAVLLVAVVVAQTQQEATQHQALVEQVAQVRQTHSQALRLLAAVVVGVVQLQVVLVAQAVLAAVEPVE